MALWRTVSWNRFYRNQPKLTLKERGSILQLTALGVTTKNQTLGLDRSTGEVDQDWGKGSPACPIHYVSLAEAAIQKPFGIYFAKD